ncbi:serine hydrolase [Hymenobacter sp. BT683]|uniref:Serine hydrolase n=1 Tax=Hymenobacter jeongseonensis TaxID=2791027 RepID=A0ABS0IMN7_9BACT|nr:serine hydrolase [Hymenobacter jeongseonensis]MBF9239627.1 serine hydrolase [Hymenobacter jeongseonensis]
MKKILTLLLVLLATAPLCAHAQTPALELEALLRAYADRGDFAGSVLVARHGKILLEKGYGLANRRTHAPNGPDTRYPIASVTKTFTAALVLHLAERNKLAITDKLSRHYPDFPHGDSITLAQLLSHTSGIYDYTQLNDFMLSETARPATEQRMLALFRNQPLDFAPGTDWRYSNSGYSLLGYIIEKATGLRYAQAIQKTIFTPLGMARSGFDYQRLADATKAAGYYAEVGKAYVKETPSIDPSISFAAGALYSTVGDLYKWHMGLQRHRTMGAASAVRAYTPVRNHYGYGWVIDSVAGQRTVSHSGGTWGFRSTLVRVPADDVCIVLLSNTETPSLDAIAKGLLAVLYGQPYQLPVTKHAIALAPEMLRPYTGTYLIKEQDLVVDVKLENGVLQTYPFHGPRGELAALSETRFFIREQEEFEVSFTRDAQGRVLTMILHANGRDKVGEKIK